MRSYVKKKLRQMQQRENVLAGLATDSQGFWHEASMLEGKAGCKAAQIRALQAGYKMPRDLLY